MGCDMKLRCTTGPLAGEVFNFNKKKIYVFGREAQPQDESIVLPSPTVSRRHCQISWENTAWFVQDLGSSNGIRLNKNKIDQSEIGEGDLLQIGAFTFIVEANDLSSGKTAKAINTQSTKTNKATQTNKRPVDIEGAQESANDSALKRHSEKLKEQYAKFQKVDFRIRMLVVVLLAAFLSHWIVTSSIVSEARQSFLKQSFEVARTAVRSLGDRNKRELAEGNYYLLDCENFALKMASAGVVAAHLFDAKGRMVCPVGAENKSDQLIEAALYRGDAIDDCAETVMAGADDICHFVFPIREWRDQQGQYVTVGVARINYRPKEAFIAAQNLQSLANKFFLLCLMLFVGVWWILQLWIGREIEAAAESTHLAVTGATQNVDRLASFAALDPLVQEINRLISRGNQGLSQNSNGPSNEASFLHSLLQQVLLLEERAVMVIDRENQLIAASASIPEVVPVEVNRMNVHITEAVTDSHLQGELIVLLNDLAQSSEVIDRALSAADRVYQVRGMPLFLNDDYAASLLIF